jgi:hypothetical protein
MCTPHKNPRILKSEDFPASNPKIFKILGFDATVRIYHCDFAGDLIATTSFLVRCHSSLLWLLHHGSNSRIIYDYERRR